ncbi:hypothetical protein JG688_00002053 [Phytophthora aleatoria]|uniref:Serine hydrolase domain-containing protein n=1 Tax=Phytophthora aleatoria TaxID=2496075 RepID=A0A8J5J3F3_9STRA|nr:hypothetical protein JG688_00002053 [Phytophthora aleatoria]
MATFRVLCLHGFGQDAPKFRNRISSLRRALKSSFDFVFPEAPFLVTSFPNSTPEEQDKIAEAEPTYKWWDFEIDEETGKHTYGRVDEAVEYLAEFVRKEGPFDGIFGFSQGGMMANLLLQRQYLGDPVYKTEQKVDVPSIHFMGKTEAIVSMERGQKLVELYNNSKVFVHPGGHFIPTNKEAKDALGETGENVSQLKWCNFTRDEETGQYLLSRVEEAIEYVANFVKKEGPFDGIFGFSQGGSMASMILQRQVSTSESPFAFRFSIFVSAGAIGDPKYMSDVKVDVPSLHIIGETDAVVDTERSLALKDLFVNPKVFMHPGGHYIPTNKEPKDAFRAFFKELQEADAQ